MTRIIAGQARGRRLAVPARGTRPTSDRVRESCFAAIDAILLREGRSWHDLRVVDLFAGSGALGLEAASRGATSVTLVEQSRAALAVLRANIAAIGLPGCTVEAGDAMAWATRPQPPIDLLLADPPYDVPAAAIGRLLADVRPSLAPGFVVVVERRVADASFMPEDWDVVDRRYGDTVLWYGREES